MVAIFPDEGLLTSPVGLAYITVIDGRGVAGGLYARLWELVLAGFWVWRSGLFFLGLAVLVSGLCGLGVELLGLRLVCDWPVV